MGGDATFAGTNYQASDIAYVFAHVLTETKLRWAGLADDTPSAVSGGGAALLRNRGVTGNANRGADAREAPSDCE